MHCCHYDEHLPLLLFWIALLTHTAPPQQFAPTLELVKEKGEAAGHEAIVDANLLTTWSALREARAADFAEAERSAKAILEAQRKAQGKADVAAEPQVPEGGASSGQPEGQPEGQSTVGTAAQSSDTAAP